jgi:hypothetical protein
MFQVTKYRNIPAAAMIGFAVLGSTGCGEQSPEVSVSRVPLPPPVAMVAAPMTESTPPEAPPEVSPTPQEAPTPPQPEEHQPAAKAVTSSLSEAAVTDGVSGEIWRWDINVNELRTLAAEGDIALIRAEDALTADYTLKRFTFSNGRWRPGGGELSTFSLDCRIVTPMWDRLYTDLPSLKASTDKWLIAMPNSFMAIVGDLRAAHGDDGFGVQLHTGNGGLIASFTDASGMPLRAPVTIGG